MLNLRFDRGNNRYSIKPISPASLRTLIFKASTWNNRFRGTALDKELMNSQSQGNQSQNGKTSGHGRLNKDITGIHQTQRNVGNI
jgi:hypothetical protein